MVTFIEEVAETKQDDSEESQTKENESKEGYAVTFLPSTITEVIEETAPAIADTKGPIKGEYFIIIIAEQYTTSYPT